MALAAAIGRRGLDASSTHFGADSPFTRLQDRLKGVDPDEIYSLVPYEKGFLFVSLLEQTAGREAFDAFIRDTSSASDFTSITTEEFVAFLRQRLPGLAEAVRAERWIHGTGIPANTPQFHPRA